VTGMSTGRACDRWTAVQLTHSTSRAVHPPGWCGFGVRLNTLYFPYFAAAVGLDTQSQNPVSRTLYLATGNPLGAKRWL
jgi:hypothetical protein